MNTMVFRRKYYVGTPLRKQGLESDFLVELLLCPNGSEFNFSIMRFHTRDRSEYIFILAKINVRNCLQFIEFTTFKHIQFNSIYSIQFIQPNH